MAKKGQKFKTYSFELKKKAIEMKPQGIPHAKIAEELGIQDVGRLKVWMKKYREQGDFGLMEHRGRRKEYKDLEREVKRLRLENDVLKKVVGDLGEGKKRLKLQVLDPLRHRHSVKDLCEDLGVSRSGY